MSVSPFTGWTMQGPNQVSPCGRLVAVYQHSYGGLATYWTFRADETKRTRANAVAIGGIPSGGALTSALGRAAAAWDSIKQLPLHDCRLEKDDEAFSNFA